MQKKGIILLIFMSLIACKSAKIQTQKTTIFSKEIKNGTSSSPQQKGEVLQATTKVKVTQELLLQYVKNYKETAKEQMRLHQIPASIIMAQALLESGAGYGVLSVKANNHFGIKCHKEWTGDFVLQDDDTEKECFRKYELPQQSFEDHSLFLTTRDRYKSLFLVPQNDYKAWANGLKAAGYATDPAYANKLISLIERYQLYRLDDEVLQLSVPLKSRYYTVQKGETLYSISKKTGITVAIIQQLNQLQDNTIQENQILKLQ